ncbi:midasin [Neodiprion fabricii]|uniref:midasin n=1 Tax=Neodiprion fabricii TaxID=2872261 RepID=UPI001ED8DA57|nr:midasin [Neodiprion fabricii]
MIIENLRIYCNRNNSSRAVFHQFIKLNTLSNAEYDDIIELLCKELMNPGNSQNVAECFPDILLLLISMAITSESCQLSRSKDCYDTHRLNCVVLGKLVHKHPDILGFTLHYFESNPAPFETIAVNQERSAKKFKPTNLEINIPRVSDFDIVLASYSILQSAPQYFKRKWNWAKFYKYLMSDEENTKWIALKCIGIVLEMSESLIKQCAKTFLKNIETFLLECDNELLDPITLTPTSVTEVSNIVKDATCIASIGGILLPVLNPNDKRKHSSLVSVPSMEDNLRSIALAVASRKCICLQGPVGCGKTVLVEYLAKVTGHTSSDFIKVQLGDQTDSKMLLGTYRCTDIPGEFVWQPGVLTQAATAGKWLLLEDIDSAALDVASVLNSLIETGTLCVPGHQDAIHVRSDFQLFLTQRLITTSTGVCKQSSGASNLLEKNWQQINVEPLSKTELVTIIQTLFPVLSTVAGRMVDVFLLFSMGNHRSELGAKESVPIRTGRLTSTRDLIKWCNRAAVDFIVSSPESALKVFQDAIDIFCCSVPDQSERLSLAIAIGNKLGIVKTKAEYFCNSHKPSISPNSDYIIAGRAKVICKKSIIPDFHHAKTNFSFTRPSSCLLERITCCVAQKEPVLLVGETGTGKTSSIQYLAQSTGHKLIVINMNQQSESTDLLGGYKPVDIKFLITPIREEFEMLFRSYFAIEPNRQFLDHISLCFNQNKWKTLVKLMTHSTSAAIKRLNTTIDENQTSTTERLLGRTAATRNSKRQKSEAVASRKIDYSSEAKNSLKTLKKWERLSIKLMKLESQVKTQFSLAFAFIEGSLIKALQKGYWVLLDEINLANAETLECLSGLLEGSCGSLSLIERGDNEQVKRHSDFTLFACMNPATDVGKKELPVGLRNRFTELYVDELTEQFDLQLLVECYLKELLIPPSQQEAIVKFYLNVRKEAVRSLADGTARKPHYSLRTLCRALSVAASNPCGSVLRSLYEALCLSFLTQLDYDSYPIVRQMIIKAILNPKEVKAILSMPIPKPKCAINEDYMNFEGYWIVRGGLKPEIPCNYILTESVRRNLKDLVRIVSIGKMPVLLQGDTSVGKTSLITYLAKASGHTCVRINNHEHTDLQEYVGSYAADENGKLIFKEGVLVEALRKGFWIILDELNLAPSDVLEALNRVLDDNREIFIPETQQTVKAHPNFMLFATQNPPGLYGGRKVLSRAFRNRFVELHFNDIPPNELQIILHERCSMPDSYCKQIINVMTDLQIRRKSTAAFAGKQGFITLRDLFRWGERYRLAPDVKNRLYDWSQHLADEGYLVLGAKVRKPEEANEIREVIKKHLKRDVNPNTLFTLDENTSSVTKFVLDKVINKGRQMFPHIVWTYHMRRLAVLVGKACQFKEPVLLVGETGGGKTTICQVIAVASSQKLCTVNCHMHTESSDFIGSLRPVRNHSDLDNLKLFEWVDGPLIQAMTSGDLFLADEISLADDSVLERLNSLLEPERSLLLTERGVDTEKEGQIGDQDNHTIVAHANFHFIGTMNPGGDYGKKELSPALRNRFTEIWCEGCSERNDLQAIIEHNLVVNWSVEKNAIATGMLDFVDWLTASEIGRRFTVSIRDILTWVDFINVSTNKRNKLSRLDIADAYYHGALLTYVDSVGSGLTGMESTRKLKDFKDSCRQFLIAQIANVLKSRLSIDSSLETDEIVADNSENGFGIKPFFIPRGPASPSNELFTFTAPTTGLNTVMLLRSLQLSKPLLLEGSPGVGKTSLVSALANISGHKLVRINLSEQTDVSDLFGADLPVEGGKGGEFVWKDGPFLQALRAGHWILLDELNLASQSVLEGLNACLDHRGELYVPELGRTFIVKPGTKLFACQNPLRQGGARRGLPKSFLNRFTQVFMETLSDVDLKFIVVAQFPNLPVDLVSKMVDFNSKLALEAGTVWGYRGSPWEMNLRDITRWCEVTIQSANVKNRDHPTYNPGTCVDLIYIDRMRTREDKLRVRDMYIEMFSPNEYPLPPVQPITYITQDRFYLGDVSLKRSSTCVHDEKTLLLLRNQTATLKSLIRCVNMNWMSILVGGSGCGKTSLVQLLAKLAGQKLRSISVNSAMDTTELLGGFEQTDYNRHLEEMTDQIQMLLLSSLRNTISAENVDLVARHHGLLEDVRNLQNDQNEDSTMATETAFFLKKVLKLSDLIAAMKAFNHSYASQLEVIETKLQRLSTLVEQDKCLNAGGKFEWVDSMLVKSLQEGSWLLIDQINLCSPAVLDRLNGLLEPNGVLTIGERGVDEEGNVIVIKPHNNFRLFLAMDPRYGEISRAMRNRGVEIYILGEQEGLETDVIDLRSLLHNSKLTRSSQQMALLRIHDEVLQNAQSGQKPSVAHLLHAAFLIHQQISRGSSIPEAVESACIDVYLRSRFVNHLPTRDRLISIIKENTSQLLSTNDDQEFIDWGSVTWKTNELQKNCQLALIRQQGAILSAIIKKHQSFTPSAQSNGHPKLTTSFLNDILEITSREFTLDIDINEIMQYLLLHFYQMSSLEDWRLRYLWLSKILSSDNDLLDLSRKNSELANEISKFEFSYTTTNLPWHPEYSPGIVGNELRQKNLNDSNRLMIILYMCALSLMEANLLKEQTLSKDQTLISIQQYSNYVYHGKLTASFTKHPLVLNFVTFLTQLDKCINLALRDDSVIVDTVNCIYIKKNLKWRTRFYNLGNLTLINKLQKSKHNNNQLEEVSLLLRVHYKWLIKFFVKLFKTCNEFALDQECRIAIKVLFAMIDDMNKSLSTANDPLRVISKQVQKFLSLPTPYASQIVVNMYPRLRQVSDVHCVTKDKGAPRLKQDLQLTILQNSEFLETRFKLVSWWQEIYCTSDLNEKIPSSLTEIERSCEHEHIALRTPTETADVLSKVRTICDKEMILRSAEVQLWPIYEYIFSIIAHNVQRRVCCKLSNDSIDTMISINLLTMFVKIPTIPVNVLAILNAVISKLDHPSEASKLLPEVFLRLSKHTENSCAVKNPGKMLHWQRIQDEDVEHRNLDEEIEVEYPMYGASLVSLVSELILEKSENSKNESILSIAMLGSYRARNNQLKIVNEILWKNAVTFNAIEYQYKWNDFGTLESYLDTYLTAVAKAEAELGVPCVDMRNVNFESMRDPVYEYHHSLDDLRRFAMRLKTKEISENDIEEVGVMWALLGYVQVCVFSNLGYIDPVHKVGLKLKYIKEDIIDCQKTLYITELQARLIGDCVGSQNMHPHIREIASYMRNLLIEEANLKTYNAIRPPSSEFVNLTREIADFRNSLGSYTILQKHLNKLTSLVEQFHENRTTINVKLVQNVIREVEMWQDSVNRFSDDMEHRFLPGYPDLVLPLLSAVAQMKHGINILVENIKKISSIFKVSCKEYKIESFMSNLVQFPTIGNDQEDLLVLVDLLPSEITKEIICKNIRTENKLSCKREIFRMIKCSLCELRNYIVLNGNLSNSLWSRFNSLLQQVVLTWQQQEKEKEEKQIQEDGLFKNKCLTKGESLTEDEEITIELHKLFPRYHEVDFGNIETDENPSLEKNFCQTEREEDETYNGLITQEDIQHINELHATVVQSFTSCYWLENNSNSYRVEYIGPLMQRYKTFGLLLDNTRSGLTNALTTKLYTSLNFLVTATAAISQGDDSDLFGNTHGGTKNSKSYDFYKDSNVKEAKECLPILEHIVDRVRSLLIEWPEHPSLKAIDTIIQRIYSFPITSSLSRFLTGLELLLVKMQEWEQNAHSAVSLTEYSMVLTQQIISWRRLELSCWMDCLNVTFERSKMQASKWWFFIYALIEGYLTETQDATGDPEQVTKGKLIESLHLFMNTSTLGEYSSRLNLLFTFHCHICHMASNERRDELLSIFWNFYKYYEQFTETVNNRIVSLKAPIEKKLKDFVKIARWNDISYWAVKETIEKTHRTLHKFIREYESKLKQNVSLCLVAMPVDCKAGNRSEMWEKPVNIEYFINQQDKSVTSTMAFEEDDKLLLQGTLLSKTETLLSRAKKLCRETILMTSYPALRTGIEQFIQEVMDHSLHLKNMDIDRTQPKPKQKSQAKSILQQKRMALATYFKALTLVGVSYRIGTLTWNNNLDKVMDLSVPPLNIRAAFLSLRKTKADTEMLQLWECCDKYYYKSFVMIDAVDRALTTNKIDLGPQNVERCRGFSTHVMLLAHEQKRTFTESFNYFLSLRLQLENLSNIQKNDLDIPEQCELVKAADSLKQLLISMMTCLEQIKLYLKTCPSEPEFGSEPVKQVITIDSINVPMINAKKGDIVWEDANSIIEKCSQRATDIKKKFDFVFPCAKVQYKLDKDQCKLTYIATSAQFSFLNESCETIEEIGIAIKNLKQLFSVEHKKDCHPILENISWLEQKMINNINQLKELKKVTKFKLECHDVEDHITVKKCQQDLDLLINIVLIAIQKLYKKNLAFNKEFPMAKGTCTKDEYQESNLEEKQLTNKLIGSLNTDIHELSLEIVFRSMNQLLTLISGSTVHTAITCNRLLLRWRPLLEQYLLFVEFYLNEQLAAFRTICKMSYLQLNVFLDLATNGFCVPKDLDMDEGMTDESQESVEKGGMGLGDGEGDKDVSDRIETEDQLDDARPENEEREEKEDKDCKEEDAGIDMSEDFDSKLQDFEKKDSDEIEDNEKDDKDLDKQMGETEKDADCLDEKIWGDDENEQDGENKDDKDENKDQGGGEESSEKEIGAKEDQAENDQDTDNQEPQKETSEEEKNEINEINDLNENDDQINPYHGKHQPDPEPEPFDLPEDMNLDDEDVKEDKQDMEENPFDIDAMKDVMPPPETTEAELNENPETDNKSEDHDSSDEEGDNPEESDLALDAQEPDENEKTETDLPDSDQQAGRPLVDEEEETDEKKNEDKENDEDTKEDNIAEPSMDAGSKETDAAEQVDAHKGGSRDKVADTCEVEENANPMEENSQMENNDKGIGQAHSKEQEQGQSGSSMQHSTPVADKNLENIKAEKRKNPGTSDENRSLVDKMESECKKLKTIHKKEETVPDNMTQNPPIEESDEAEMYQHIKSADKYDKHTLDAATEEQVREQASNIENQEIPDEKNDTMDVEMHADEEHEHHNENDVQNPEKLSDANKDKEMVSRAKEKKRAEDGQRDMNIEVDGETAETARVGRGYETMFHTNIRDSEDSILPSKVLEQKRLEVEAMLGQWSQMPPTEEATAAWNCLSTLTDGPARDLSEKLRLVLEPTQASRLKGDYRTGRRINMRKVIPYIASQFRKDKIWMRRTKLSKRDYQIVLAVDDSSSMADNHSKELAFESLALISKAMTYLEVGQLCVMNFGETTHVLHPLGEAFNEHTGSKLIQQMRFEQKKTMVGQLVDFTVDMFSSQASSTDNAKLLVVLSDGRGIFSEGVDKVNFAVRRARMADIFLVFIIVDNPINKDSILDIRMPVFQGGKLVSIRSYMDNFPFPFYMILRDINALPAVLSDALRQWFELVGKIDT